MLREKYHTLVINLLDKLPAAKSAVSILTQRGLTIRVAAVFLVATGLVTAQLLDNGFANTSAETALANNQGQQCNQPTLYGVSDKNLADSIFFKYEINSQTITTINQVDGADIEAIDIQPTTQVIYGLSGDYGDPISNKRLVIIDPVTGIPNPLDGVQLDITVNSEYKGASFHPLTGALWAAGHGLGGLRIVNLQTGASQLQVQINGEIEALAWNPDGSSLYFTKNDNLYRYDISGDSVTSLCSIGQEVEGLEFDLNGNLVAGYHDPNNSNIKVISPTTCEPLSQQPYQITLPDIETFTFKCDDPPPPDKGIIIVKKETDPDDDPQSFDFTSDWGVFTLTDGQENNSGPLDPGTYAVAETLPAGWQQTSATCDDSSPVSAIELTANETVTCTFVNTKLPADTATLIVVKHVADSNPADPNKTADQFTINVSAGSGTFTDMFLGAEAPGVSRTVPVGDYSVDEADTFGYTKSLDNCSGTLTAGQTKTCTITNNDPGGGGGGGCTGASCNPNPSPVNATITCGPNATLSFSYGSDVTGISISNSSDFSNATAISPVSSLAWPVPAGDGQIVYVKFQRLTGSIEIRQATTFNCTTPPPQVLSCVNLVTAEAEQAKSPNQSLVSLFKGKILLQAEAHGELWYVHTVSGLKYYLPGQPHTITVLTLLADGISQSDLAKIPLGISPNIVSADTDSDGLVDIFEEALGTSPINADTDGDSFADKVEVDNGYNPNGSGKMPLKADFAAKQAGRFFLQVEGAGQIWYVNPADNKRYFIPSDSANAYNVLASFSQGIGNADLRQVPVGVEIKGVDLTSYAGCYVPTPTVLGASELPRTGFPLDLAQLVVLPSLAAYPWLKKRYASALARHFARLTA